MKMKYILILLFAFNLNAQKLHHQMLSAQASSAKTTNGRMVKQTIGQLSVVGNSQNKKIAFSQGFQQSNTRKVAPSSVKSLIVTTLYPNPVSDFINFKFSASIKGPVKIAFFDLLGRKVFSTEKEAILNNISLKDIDLPQGEYIVKLNALNYEYTTKILKIK